jgi:hypothetical protein
MGKMEGVTLGGCVLSIWILYKFMNLCEATTMRKGFDDFRSRVYKSSTYQDFRFLVVSQFITNWHPAEILRVLNFSS